MLQHQDKAGQIAGWRVNAYPAYAFVEPFSRNKHKKPGGCRVFLSLKRVCPTGHTRRRSLLSRELYRPV